MRANSLDLRERVLRAVDEGKPRTQIIELFHVSRATIKRYWKQRRESRHGQPPAIAGGPPKKERSGAASTRTRTAARALRWAARRLLSVVGKPIWHPGQPEHDESSEPASRLDAKTKTLAAREQNQQDRASWREPAKPLDVEQLLFVDECGSNIALTPRDAWALKGQRAAGSVPRTRGKNTPLIAALSLEGMGESLLLEGAAQAQTFEVYGEQMLAPSLQPGQMVVMDNASIHKGKKVRQALEAGGCHRLFLPSYSPDFSPIEEAFSKLKAFLRRTEARRHEALQEAFIEA